MSERLELEKYVDVGPIEIKGYVGPTRLYPVKGIMKQMFLLTSITAALDGTPMTDHAWLGCHPTNPAKDPVKGSEWQGFVTVIPYRNNIGNFGFKMIRLLTTPKPKPIIKNKNSLIRRTSPELQLP